MRPTRERRIQEEEGLPGLVAQLGSVVAVVDAATALATLGGGGGAGIGAGEDLRPDELLLQQIELASMVLLSNTSQAPAACPAPLPCALRTPSVPRGSGSLFFVNK